MTPRITHAKAPMPDVEVIDLDRGVIVEGVEEVDSDKGWIVKRSYPGGMFGGATLERVKGRFRIRRRGSL